MNYFIGEKREKIKFDYYISEGEEGNVYRTGAEVVKIYFRNWQNSYHGYLTEEEATQMTTIPSNHILLPRRLVYNENDEFCGYTTKYIRSYYGDSDYVENYHRERTVIERMRLFFLIKKIAKIYEEVRYLSQKGIIIADLLFPTDNYIFNGEFWIIDPGCYSFSDEPIEKILEENIKTLNSFFISNLFYFGEEFFDQPANIPPTPTYTVCDYLQENGKKLEKTLQFMKRMEKKKN